DSGDATAADRVQGTRPCRHVGGANELAGVGLQLVFDAAYLGRLSEVAPRCDGSAAGLRRACDDGDPGLLWADLDPVHEVRLAPALHLSAERAGLHRPADCRLLPARCPLPPSQWQGIAGSAVDWFC